MPSSASPKPSPEPGDVQSAGQAEPSDGATIESLSQKDQEFPEASQALVGSGTLVRTQEHLMWNTDTDEADKTEPEAAGTTEPMPQMSTSTSSTDEHKNRERNTLESSALPPYQAERMYGDNDSLDPSVNPREECEATPILLEDILFQASQIGHPEYDDDEKHCIVGILFIKILSDKFESARQSIVNRHAEDGMSRMESEEIAEDKILYGKNCFVPKRSRWNKIASLSHNIRDEILKACKELERCHPSIKGALSSIACLHPLLSDCMDSKLAEIISHFSSVTFVNSDDIPSLFANGCDYLNDFYAEGGDGSSKKCSRIPDSVSNLLISLIKPQGGMNIYNPGCGLGSLLIETTKYLADQGHDIEARQLTGDEADKITWAMCKLNLFLHGIDNAEIRSGEMNRGQSDIQSQQHDLIIFNHPADSYSLDSLQRMIMSLSQNGMMGALVSRRFLSRGIGDGEIRQQLINSDLVEAVITLPSRLSFDANCPDAIIIFNAHKEICRKGNVLFIDAAHDWQQGSSRRVLTNENIGKIKTCYEQFSEIEDYSKIAPTKELVSRSYSLEVSDYVDASPEALQIKRLASQYDDYSILPLLELIHDVKCVNSETASDNAGDLVYVSENAVGLSYSALGKDCHYAFQLLTESSKVISGYLVLFLQSELGSLMRAKLVERELILREESLLSLAIPIPEISIQLQMTEAAEGLEELRSSIQKLEEELIFSPPSASAVLEQVDGMLDAVGSLTDADRIMSLIRQGESKSIEYKESFSLDIRKNSAEKYIELSSLKTIAAFLNSEGGCLLVGVSDSGLIVGLDSEINKLYKGSKDRFMLHFKNNLKSRIGEEYYPFINQKLVSVRGLAVLLVECKKSSSGCFLDGKDFYVRTNPSTDKLEGPRLVSYIRNNFPS